jgi:hypothetical protein
LQFDLQSDLSAVYTLGDVALEGIHGFEVVYFHRLHFAALRGCVISIFRSDRSAKLKERQTEEGKEIYSQRNHTVETAFGIIKEVMDFEAFAYAESEKSVENGS